MSGIDWSDAVAKGAALAAEAITEHGPGAIEALADFVESRADKDLTGAARAVAVAGAGALRGNAPRLARLTSAGLIGLTGLYWTHGEQAAREAYMRHFATKEELFEAADAIDAQSIRSAHESTWEDIAAVLGIVADALPYIVPIFALLLP